MREKELVIRLNKNLGAWNLLKEFDENLLADIGFTREEIDDMFDIGELVPEEFDLKKELEKLDITAFSVQKGVIGQKAMFSNWEMANNPDVLDPAVQ